MKSSYPTLTFFVIAACRLLGASNPNNDLQGLASGADKLIVRTGTPQHDAHVREVILSEVVGKEAVREIMMHVGLEAMTPTHDRDPDTGQIAEMTQGRLLELPHYTLALYSGSRQLVAVGLLGLVIARGEGISDGRDVWVATKSTAYLKERFDLLESADWIVDPKTKDWILFGPSGEIRANKAAEPTRTAGTPPADAGDRASGARGSL